MKNERLAAKAARGLVTASAALAAACSSDGGGLGTGTAELGIMNAATSAIGAQLKLDGNVVTLPSIGQVTTMSVTPGAHQITLVSASGAQLASSSFTIPDRGRRTAVFTGSNVATVSLSITSDTMATNPGGGYHSIVGSILLVNSVPGQGPFTVVFHQTGSDSVYHFGNFGYGSGSLPPPSPYGFSIPFVPAVYRIDITNPGSETSLATTQVTVATDDRWIVTLMSSIEGQLVLQATKQP